MDLIHFLRGLEDKVYCIYISPLKSLDNDIKKNLDEPLSEIGKIAKKMVLKNFKLEKELEMEILANMNVLKYLNPHHIY